MTLPETVDLCDAVELAALTLKKGLSVTDLTRLFFPGQHADENPADPRDGAAPEMKIRDALGLAATRSAACVSGYPFEVTERSIKAQRIIAFNPYVFLLLGRTLNFGGPENSEGLLRAFRKHFEDVVCWAMRKAGFASEVLSEPRAARGLPVPIGPALRELAARFGEAAMLLEEKLEPADNDLDVDVLAVPLKNNARRGGWPVFLIQCATGKLVELQAKVSEGSSTFSGVWERGFFEACCVRTGATPFDLLILSENHWERLGKAGWILDRTRIAYLASSGGNTPVPKAVATFWNRLWAARSEIDWQSGWQ